MIKMPWVLNGSATDPCCCTPKTCHDKYGDTINSALSGVIVCGGCQTVSLADDNAHDVTFAITGVNGMAAPTWNGTNWVATSVGSGTVTVYESNDGTCSGEVVETQSGFLDLTVSCSGDNQMSAIVSGQVALASGNVNLVAFETVGGYTFGDPMPNFRTIVFCGSGGASSMFFAYDGTMTLST